MARCARSRAPDRDALASAIPRGTRARATRGPRGRGPPESPQRVLQVARRDPVGRTVADLRRWPAPRPLCRGGHHQRATPGLGRDREGEDDDRPDPLVTRIGVQDRLVPGSTLAAKYEVARRYGFDALELSERPAFDEARVAIREEIPVTAIAGGYRGWLIDPNPKEVAAARADLAALLDLAGELGTGIVVVPIWGRTRHLPGIATGRTRDQDEELFLEGLRPLAERAERAGARIFLEPLNRYQNDLCVTIADAVRFRDALDSPSVLVVGDTFHMNIEEADILVDLRRARWDGLRG
ncbi:MAG: sugar phosphate isomerase/epimerase [Chloroflexi bacterium]|nr:MAG: sugar phosphate isomerase/epimerase [Chloroflexota bacterium]